MIQQIKIFLKCLFGKHGNWKITDEYYYRRKCLDCGTYNHSVGWGDEQ